MLESAKIEFLTASLYSLNIAVWVPSSSHEYCTLWFSAAMVYFAFCYNLVFISCKDFHYILNKIMQVGPYLMIHILNQFSFLEKLQGISVNNTLTWNVINQQNIESTIPITDKNWNSWAALIQSGLIDNH